jgi:hypothetical protein
MKKTMKKIGLKTETLRNLAQHKIRDLADHELKVAAGGGCGSINLNMCLI